MFTKLIRFRHIRPETKQLLIGYTFILPWLIGLFAFTAGPILLSFYQSFTSYSIFEPGKWVGLYNYQKILTQDKLFWDVVYNTIYYVVVRVPLHIILALLIAMALNRASRGKAIFRTAFYLPTVIPMVATAAVWAWMLDTQVGIMKFMFDSGGIAMPNWFGSVVWAKPAIILMSLWQVGTIVVVFLAGLQDVPSYLYEAVDIDGGGAWSKFINITLPMLTPTILFNVIMDVINSFQVFAFSFILTGGGPLNSTLFYVLYIYKYAFNYFEMGYASSLSTLLFLLILALTVIIFKVSNKWVNYDRI